MPKISINERDLTTVALENVTNNVVYIPGYAITGPINTPTLCSTLDEFKQLFGELPYVFRNSYDYLSSFDLDSRSNAGSFINVDSYEKSYMMASELVSNGLPVLFERYVPGDIELAFTAFKDFGTLQVKAKYPGSAGNLIKCKVSLEDEDSQIYRIEVQIDKNEVGIKPLDLETYLISLDKTNSNYIGKFKSEYITINNPTEGIISSETFVNLELPERAYIDGSSRTTLREEFEPSSFYNALTNNKIFEKLEDKGEYQIKFITAGGYPVFGYNSNSIVTEMLKAAGNRGDSVAIIDHTNNISRELTGSTSVFNKLNSLSSIKIGSSSNPDDALRYGAMFTPYASYNINTLDNRVEIMPASFAYLNSLAVSVRTNANWYAVAGVTRGLIPNLLQLSQNITGAIAETYQPTIGISINPITNIKPYGYCIWGNRTLNKNEKGLIASSFLNIRMLANDVKKVVYTAAKKLTFELNTDLLWLNFKSEIEPTLDKMVSGNGLTGYRILRKTTTKRATIEAVIRLFVVEAVEDWDITIELSDTTVTVQ